ncbi:vanillate O-demethylase ferredoxin subunit [Devosia subaequoris]|uniref:Vanillate O-demethylase ferredoxin subunit n=1 Tax=Devosia subaequoris TaxID=395930 RepID=A0A7W6IN19_9HYPH|nr:PDR/VanB family oxidoreductase [Devosia subaequoris]MBB4052598.1 vanillate O-demethylase ferredoxin subunit [Devosia subaequoris]MCP1209754.1 PDR/VanB family oxidoreductase [Devosia subaequoris]
MRNKVEWRNGKVAEIRQVAEDVRYIGFAVDGPVPRFDPGSHSNIAVEIDGAAANRTYTVIPAPPGQIAVAVKLHPQSRGGSRYMWSLHEGQEVRLTLPENRFELSWRAKHYLLLAGGIGITPIYGMAKALVARGASVRVVYAARSRGLMAFANELEALLGDRLILRDNSQGQHIDLDAEFAALPGDAECYLCGPIGMLEAAKAAWTASGRPVSRLRYEVFGDSGLFAEKPFSVEVLNRGTRVAVRSDQSLLDALIGAGVEMIHDCRRGECGLCAVQVMGDGVEIDHRDVFFSAEEKAEGHKMCACVSRLTEGHAVIDVGYRN